MDCILRMAQGLVLTYRIYLQALSMGMKRHVSAGAGFRVDVPGQD